MIADTEQRMAEREIYKRDTGEERAEERETNEDRERRGKLTRAWKMETEDGRPQERETDEVRSEETEWSFLKDLLVLQ